MAGPEASAPSPQVALLVPVQGPKPVVEAEQTGLRDYGTEGGRVTQPRALGTRGGTLPGRPRAAVGGTGACWRGRPPGTWGPRCWGCRRSDDALPRGNRATRASPLPPHPSQPAALPGSRTPGCPAPPGSRTRPGPARREGAPDSRARHPGRSLEPPPLRTPRVPGSEPRSQPVSRRMLSPSGMRAAWEPREPMAAPAESPGPACSPPAPGRGRPSGPSGPRAEGRGPGAEPGSGTPACLASHPRPRRTENNAQGGGVRGAARTTGRFIPRWSW